MKSLISLRLAAILAQILLALLIIYHLYLLLTLLSGNEMILEKIWGGNMNKLRGPIVLESLSIALLTIFLILTNYCYRLLESREMRRHRYIARRFCRIFAALFFINTLLNLLIGIGYERFFALISLVLALLYLRMIKGKRVSKRAGRTADATI